MQEGTEFAALAADQVTRAEEFDLKVVDQIAEDCAAAARVLEMITDAAIEQWLSDTSAFLEERRRQRPKEMLDRGRLQMKQGRHGEAEAAYRDAIASDHPDHAPAAMVYLGELLQERGRYVEAEAAYRDAIASDHPDHAPFAMFERGLLLRTQRRHDGAETPFVTP
jgi:tetratricopeptide (TPR) repeat protein